MYGKVTDYEKGNVFYMLGLKVVDGKSFMNEVRTQKSVHRLIRSKGSTTRIGEVLFRNSYEKELVKGFQRVSSEARRCGVLRSSSGRVDFCESFLTPTSDH